MIPKTQSLLLSLVFLCGPQEALLSPLGRCSKNEICSFISAVDFEGAEGFCAEYTGELYKFSSKENTGSLLTLLGASSGKYWLQSTNGTGPNCAALSVMEGQDATVVRVPCQEKLDGMFCKMPHICAPFEAPGGSPVTYTFIHFKFDNSEFFPGGTVAVAQRVGSDFPDSSHLCVSEWLRAPWACEVNKGGCQSNCSSVSSFHCFCPPGEHLHHNNISCSRGPRAESGGECQQVGDSFECKCARGFRQDQDGKSCVDVDECKEERMCTAGGQECVNTNGSYECRCKEVGFVLEDGACVNVSICKSCEHDCAKINGEYRCACRNGFMVSPSNPSRCNQNCTERDCRCVSKGGSSCECPVGYVKDTADGKAFCTDINECESQMMCEHKCENLFGGYRCLCDEGFQLQDTDRCVRLEEEEGDEEDASGSSHPGFTEPSTPAGAHPALLPYYIKTGSVLGITVFIVLAAGLLALLLRNAFKRCGKFQLPSLKRPDIDIYLQQVTTETYKRLSLDKQFKSDSQKPDLNQ